MFLSTKVSIYNTNLNLKQSIINNNNNDDDDDDNNDNSKCQNYYIYEVCLKEENYGFKSF